MYFYEPNDFIVGNSTGNIGIGTTNPNSTLDVNGTINATAYQGATITQLSNLGISASNMAVYGSNVARDTSNISYPTSNVSYSLSNYVYSTNTTNVIAAQATANFGSNVAVFGSNTAVFGSNTAVFGSNEANLGRSTAIWSSNNLLTKSGGTISGNLLVTGTTQAQGTLYVGMDSGQMTNGTYPTGKIMFGGVFGDNGFSQAQIACRRYEATGKKSELVIAKYNDPDSGSVGPDRMRLRGGGIAFDTYSGYENPVEIFRVAQASQKQQSQVSPIYTWLEIP
jgi:hypothetical protein